MRENVRKLVTPQSSGGPVPDSGFPGIDSMQNCSDFVISVDPSAVNSC